MVPSGLVTACLRAGSPTSSSPSLVNATYEGKAFPPMLVPSALGMIVGLPPSMTDAAELLVPKSIPIILVIVITCALRYLDLGAPQHLVAEVVSFLENFQDLAVLPLSHRERFVDGGVELPV